MTVTKLYLPTTTTAAAAAFHIDIIIKNFVLENGNVVKRETVHELFIKLPLLWLVESLQVLVD